MLSIKLFAATLLFALIVGCDNNHAPIAESQNTTTPSNPPTQGINQNTKPLKASKTVDQIDFSNYPGAKTQAAFGYYFGLTINQIESSGIHIDIIEKQGPFVLTRTNSAPSPWVDAEAYTLVFYEGKLQLILGTGKTITEDSAGIKGKQKYKELNDALIAKYGKPKISQHSVGHAVWNESDEFYQCLSYDGCGAWESIWTGGEKSITLRLKGLGKRGVGFIEISYQSPEMIAARNKSSDADKAKTSRGL